jgi:UDP-N-acetylglucosamine--dolichyl-phosphate N-acetylglucosaminephosphotransferase
MIIPIIIFIISFFSTFFAIPWLIRYLRRTNLIVKDQNKKNKPLIPLSGGLAVMGGIFLGLVAYIFIRTFLFNDSSNLLYFFAAITTILLITFVGFIDDSIIKCSKEASAGLKQWQKPLLTLIAAIPLVAIGAGTSEIYLPLIGVVNLGLVYPLVLIPIMVIFFSNAVNLLAGFNGLEAGMGLIYTGMLGLYAYINGSYVAAIIALTTFAALLAFIRYNWTPAKIFPGDSLTYLLGGVLACIAILGNIEKAVIIVSIPFIIEFILKARSGFKAQSFGYWKNGKIHSQYGRKIYSLTHLFSRTGKFTEKQIVLFLMIIELIFALLIWVV